MNILVTTSRLSSYLVALAFHKKKISAYFGIPYTSVDNYYKEIISSEFYDLMRSSSGSKQDFMNLTMLSVLRAPTFYVLCRIIKPEVVVETGVADGFSSSFILEALRKNGEGRLYSIDLPNQPGQILEKNKVTGWIVPEILRSRWELILGSSREKLPALLEHLKSINIFYHDSEHSYENMAFEFNVSFPYIKKEGLIISDDITDNNAFNDFCVKFKSKPLKLFKTGILKKI
jgi:predicted O-methyltransferase YrrM